jgi:hypothetical protein
LVGNVSFPIAVQLHAVKPECPHTVPTTEPCSASNSKINLAL